MEYIIYVKPNERDYITAVDSSAFLTDTTGWVEIDRGYGDRFHHAQNNYFPKSIYVIPSGAYRYKLVNGKPVECTAEELAKQEAALQPEEPTAVPTVWDELDAAYQTGYTEGYQEGVNTAYDE